MWSKELYVVVFNANLVTSQHVHPYQNPFKKSCKTKKKVWDFNITNRVTLLKKRAPWVVEIDHPSDERSSNSNAPYHSNAVVLLWVPPAPTRQGPAPEGDSPRSRKNVSLTSVEFAGAWVGEKQIYCEHLERLYMMYIYILYMMYINVYHILNEIETWTWTWYIQWWGGVSWQSFPQNQNNLCTYTQSINNPEWHPSWVPSQMHTLLRAFFCLHVDPQTFLSFQAVQDAPWILLS